MSSRPRRCHLMRARTAPVQPRRPQQAPRAGRWSTTRVRSSGQTCAVNRPRSRLRGRLRTARMHTPTLPLEAQTPYLVLPARCPRMRLATMGTRGRLRSSDAWRRARWRTSEDAICHTRSSPSWHVVATEVGSSAQVANARIVSGWPERRGVRRRACRSTCHSVPARVATTPSARSSLKVAARTGASTSTCSLACHHHQCQSSSLGRPILTLVQGIPLCSAHDWSAMHTWCTSVDAHLLE